MFKLFRRKKTVSAPTLAVKPSHIAIIMDGNGRWANAHGLTRVAGHKKGVEAVKEAIKGCVRNEIPYLSIFAFSSENWNRPQAEVSALMLLLTNALESQTDKLNEHGVKLNMIGDLSKFSDEIQTLAKKSQDATAHNTKLVLSVAINYGGRWDITNACKKIAKKVVSGDLNIDDIDELLVSQNTVTHNLPDPDLFIRTSGEYRLSNFFLWQAAYSEFYFTDLLWPDFNEEEFNQALITYAKRDRRYGKVKNS